MRKVKGVLVCEGQVRISKPLQAEMQVMAAEQGRQLPKVNDAWDLLDASLAMASRDTLEDILAIQERIMKKHGLIPGGKDQDDA